MITLGLCLPASCTSNEISFILEKTLHDILIGDLLSMNFQLIQVKDLKDNHKWSSNGALLFIWYVLRDEKFNYFIILCKKEFNNIINNFYFNSLRYMKNQLRNNLFVV